MRKPRAGGGWASIVYTFRKAREAGGVVKLWRALRTNNTCKTCAVGMGGQRGGMVNELGRFPEVCKKSIQAMTADMQGAIDREFWETYPIGKLRSLSPRELESCGRLSQPVRYTKESGKYSVVPWDEALDIVSRRLATTDADKTFWYFSGRSSNEAGFLLQLFARLFGTNNVNNCSYYCHQASGVGLSSAIGSGTATVVLEDIDQSDLVFAIGCNPASNHPRLMRSFMDVRRRGGEVVVVNPIREAGLERFKVPSDPRSLIFGSKIASRYVQPHIGGDLALLTGIAKRIVEMGAHDVDFLTSYCSGWPEYRDFIEAVDWEEVWRKCGVPADEINAIADVYAASRNTIFSWAMGITHHAHGVENVQAVANLALLRGMIGRPGCGLMPIRGHSNVQGMGSVGVTPKLKKAVLANLQSHFGVSLPDTPGRDTMACMEGAERGELTFGFCLGGNLYGSNPDAAYSARALSKLDMLVYMSTTLNTGHAWGAANETIILPVLARDEEPEPTTQESMFNYVRMSDGGTARFEGPRSEVDVIAAIAQRVRALREGARGDGAVAREDLASVDWESMRRTKNIRNAIGKIVPGFQAMSEIDDTRQEFQIGGRTLHKPGFPTADGKAVLHKHTLPSTPAMANGAVAGTLSLMTMRSEGQFNTVVYEEHDLYRGVARRDVILMHPDDMATQGFGDGDLVTVRGPAGALVRIRATTFDRIKPGNAAMYYPEANRLISRRVDPKSRTPAFKGVAVTVEAS